MLSLAIGVPVVLGLVLLAVPDVLLLLRWSIAPCVRVIESPDLRIALRRSAVLRLGPVLL